MSKQPHPQITLLDLCDELLRLTSKYREAAGAAASPAVANLIDRILDTRLAIKNPHTNQPTATK